MDLILALGELENSKKLKKDWRDVAGIVRSVQESGTWQTQFATPTALYEKIAETSGYSVGVIRRMCSVFDFLQKVSSEISGFKKLETLPGAKFNFPTIEIFKRLYDLDKKAVSRTLPAYIKGEKTPSEIKELYAEKMHKSQGGKFSTNRLGKNLFGVDAVSYSRKAGVAAAKEFIQSASEAARMNLPQMTASSSARFYLQHYKFRYMRPQAVAFELDGYSPKWVDGFEFRNLVGSTFMTRISQVISDVALSASFFRHYWVVLPKSDRQVDRLHEDFTNLGLMNVGIAQFDVDQPDQLELIRLPQGIPVPDRRHNVIAGIVEQGIPELVGF